MNGMDRVLSASRITRASGWRVAQAIGMKRAAWKMGLCWTSKSRDEEWVNEARAAGQGLTRGGDESSVGCE